MNITLLTHLQAEGLISLSSVEKIKSRSAKKLFSLHWEIKTLLYLGILLLSGGLGILVYKHIDTIGHQAILLFIALLCTGSFIYCFKKRRPFSTKRVSAPNVAFDYILLLGCLMFITFVAYLQYQYQVFGNRFGLATFFPMMVLFFTAYYFDHLGILSLAITNMAMWLGITVTPRHILESNDFSSTNIIITGILLGILLIAAGVFSLKTDLKKHFEFTYTNFGMHILFISALAAMFQFNSIYLFCFLFLAGAAYYFYQKAMQGKSFYLLLITTLYTYVGITYVVLNLISYMRNTDMAVIYLGVIYFITSGIGLVLFLMHSNKKLKTDDSI